MATITKRQYVRNARVIGWVVYDEARLQENWRDNIYSPILNSYLSISGDKKANGECVYCDAYFDFEPLPTSARDIKLLIAVSWPFYGEHVLYAVNEPLPTGPIPSGKAFSKTAINLPRIETTDEWYSGGYSVSVNSGQNTFCFGFSRSEWGEYIDDKDMSVYLKKSESLNPPPWREQGLCLEYEITECNITNVACTQNNIDEGLKFTWNSEYQTGVDVKIYKGTTLKATKTVTTAKTATFPIGAIRESGDYIVKLTGCDGVTTERTFTFTKTIPTVYALNTNIPAIGDQSAIGISWNSNNQTSYTCTVGNTAYTGTTATSFAIPLTALTNGVNTNVSLSVKYTAPWGEVRQATATDSFIIHCNLTTPRCTQSNIDSPLSFSWYSDYQKSVTVNIYKDNVLKATKSVTTAKTITFASGAIREDGAHKVTFTTDDGVTVQDTFTFSKHTPTVSGLDIDVPTMSTLNTVRISWDSNNQTSYSCAVGNEHYIGTTATSFTIPCDDLNNGTSNVRLYVDYTTSWGEVRRATTTGSFNISCNVTDLQCTQNNIDNGLIFTWDSERQRSVIVKIYKGTTLKATRTVTTAKTATFPVGSVRSDGEHTVTFTSDDGVTVEETFTFTKITPTVSNLEPDGLSKDGRETIGISWTSTNQTSYICNVGGNNYIGTSNKSIILPANTLEYGTNTINLKVRYTTSWGEVREATTTATFTVYGAPTRPIITSSTIFSTGTPCFTWTSTGQTTYKLTVKQGISVIFTTGEIISINKYFVTTMALENNEEYQVYLQIKNKYNIWSEEAAQDITIEFDIPTAPSLTAFQGDNAIVLNISNETTPTNYKFSEIYRRDSLTDAFTRIALNLPENGAYYDYFVAHDMQYEYFARNYNQAGGYNDSDSIIITAKVRGYGLYDIENSSNKIVFTNDVNISDSFKGDTELINMANSKAPYSERGISDYLSCKVTYKTSKLAEFYALQRLEKTAKVLMYKDKQGRKMPCNVIGDIGRVIDKFGFITVNLTLTEVQFKECDYIDGGNEGKVLLMWNGTWQFDGTHSFGGE